MEGREHRRYILIHHMGHLGRRNVKKKRDGMGDATPHEPELKDPFPNDGCSRKGPFCATEQNVASYRTYSTKGGRGGHTGQEWVCRFHGTFLG